MATAVEFVRRNPQARFVLTELIVNEIATRVRARASAGPAAALAHSLLESCRYELVFVVRDLLRGAAQSGLTSAFTFDSDFRDCGYTMVP